MGWGWGGVGGLARLRSQPSAYSALPSHSSVTPRPVTPRKSLSGELIRVAALRWALEPGPGWRAGIPRRCRAGAVTGLTAAPGSGAGWSRHRGPPAATVIGPRQGPGSGSAGEWALAPPRSQGATVAGTGTGMAIASARRRRRRSRLWAVNTELRLHVVSSGLSWSVFRCQVFKLSDLAHWHLQLR